MRNIFGAEAADFSMIEKKSADIFFKYNYSPIRVPVIEHASLFSRSIGEATDIVEKEMYAFQDKGGRNLALRPEGTAGVVKAYIEENLAQKFPSQKFFYSGQMFRQERPQAGRYREFAQIGCEYFGNASVYADIEVIALACEILAASGIKNTELRINSIGCEKCRPAFVESVKEKLKQSYDTLCDDCKRRFEKNPLRTLDCKIDTSVFSGLKIKLCGDCERDFEELKSGLNKANIKFTVSDTLVRGLDYYTKTVFEIVSGALGSQNAVCAGGRYDNLVKELGGMPTPAVGFALGVDRMVEILKQSAPVSGSENACVFVAAFGGTEVLDYAFGVLKGLRDSGVVSDGGYFSKSIKAQMRQAGALNSSYVVIVGEDELKNGVVALKNMKTKEQRIVAIKDIESEMMRLQKTS